MVDMNFVLPMTKDDLLSANSPDDRYSVEEVYGEKEIFKKLHGTYSFHCSLICSVGLLLIPHFTDT